MKEETRKQLILSLGVLAVLIISMVMWYDNFVFHTYIKKVDFQECFWGYNDIIMIDGYELGQDSFSSYYGGARLLSTKVGTFKKNDLVNIEVTIENHQGHKMELKHQYKIKYNDEVIFLNTEQQGKFKQDTSIEDAKLTISIKRGKKVVYDEQINLHSNELLTYTGGNKNYKIQDVYVSDTWLKTGYFSTTIRNLSEQYDECIIDYTYLKEGGNKENLDDYERMAQVSLPIDEMLAQSSQKTYFYDGEGSLLDKEIICFVTLKNAEESTTFVVDLRQIVKAGVNNG